MVEQLPDETGPSKVLVTLTDGRSVEVKDAHAVGDTLYGYGQRSSLGASGRKEKKYWDVPKAIPLESIVKIEERSIDGWKTGLVVLGGLIVVGGIVGVAYLASYDYY
jgi:hypothetical protein